MIFLELLTDLSNHLDSVWTFMLFLARYGGVMYILPGIGGGERGLMVRTSAIVVMAGVSVISAETAPLPADMAMLVLGMFMEVALGVLVGMIPLIIVSGIQTAAQLASTTMGLGAASLVDPNLGVSVSDLSRILGDLIIVMFLLLGGHRLAIYAVSGFSGEWPVGWYFSSSITAELLVTLTGSIFEMGVMLSAPVIVALLLTQFVMGLISKAVPQVNIFIVSFPLTIGIGLVLSGLAIPDMIIYMEHKFSAYEKTLVEISADFQAPVGASPTREIR